MSSIAVFGALADTRNLGDGGSSDVHPLTAVTPLEGLRAALPDATVTHHADADTDAAAAADLALVVVGYTRADEGEFIGDSGTSHLRDLLPGPDDPELVAAFEARLAAEPPDPVRADEPAGHGGFATGGDRTSLDLRPDDEALIHAVAAVQPSTVVAVMAGSAVTMEHWRDDVAAIVQLWYPGMEGGHGLADVLLGERDASGRLPFSVPTDAAHLPPFDADADAVTYDRWHGHWRLARDGHPAAFPFGFGLSYTSWRLEEATATVDADTITVRALLANTGARPGTDVVQVYGGRPADSGRPPRRLLAFERVDVPAGGSTEVVLQIPWARLAVRARAAGTWCPGPTSSPWRGTPRTPMPSSSPSSAPDRSGRVRDRGLDPAGSHPPEPLARPTGHLLVAGRVPDLEPDEHRLHQPADDDLGAPRVERRIVARDLHEVAHRARPTSPAARRRSRRTGGSRAAWRHSSVKPAGSSRATVSRVRGPEPGRCSGLEPDARAPRPGGRTPAGGSARYSSSLESKCR